MKTVAWLFGAFALLAAGPASAQERSDAGKEADARGSWVAALASLDQKFVIYSSGAGLRGSGAAGGFSWDVTGSISGRKIKMTWPYREVGYTVFLEATLDKSGRKMLDGTWSDSNGIQGKWTAGRDPGRSKDTLLVNGEVKGGKKKGATVTLTQKAEDGSVLAIQQTQLDDAGEYEFLVDIDGKYLVEASAGFCVDGPSTCKRQSKVFKLQDSGRGREQEKTVNFVSEKDF